MTRSLAISLWVMLMSCNRGVVSQEPGTLPGAISISSANAYLGFPLRFNVSWNEPLKGDVSLGYQASLTSQEFAPNVDTQLQTVVLKGGETSHVIEVETFNFGLISSDFDLRVNLFGADGKAISGVTGSGKVLQAERRKMIRKLGTSECVIAENDEVLCNGFVIDGAKGAVEVSGEWEAGCAVMPGGKLKCWGKHVDGVSENDRRAKNMPDVGAIAHLTVHTGFYGGCLILLDKTVKCWGANQSRQLGGASASDNFTTTPVLVAGISSAEKLATNGRSVCAVVSEGRVKCWGDDFASSLGPLAEIPNLSAVTQISGDGNEFAVLTRDGKMSFFKDAAGSATYWGTQLKSFIDRTTDGVDVVTSRGGGCLLKNNKTVQCWGGNTDGVFGWNPKVDGEIYLLPYTNVKGISFYESNLLVLFESGELIGLGYGNRSLNRDGSSQIPFDLRMGKARRLFSNYGGHCAILLDGPVNCWGARRPVAKVNAGTSVQELALGINDYCSLSEQGAVACGEMGKSAFPIPELVGFRQITGGFTAYCGLKKDGTVLCWRVAVKPGETAITVIPTNSSTNMYKRLSGHEYRWCGIRTDDSVECWYIDDPLPWTAARLSTSQPFEQLVVGDSNLCGLTSTKRVLCANLDWDSSNKSYVVGNFEEVQLNSPTKLTPGLYRNCAISISGGLQCWLGRNSPTPTTFNFWPEGVRETGAELSSFCVLTNKDRVKCIGSTPWTTGKNVPEVGMVDVLLPLSTGVYSF